MKLPDKLFKAAADGNAAMIARLKARGVSVFCRDDDDNTPLHVAAERGHRAAVYQLLRREGSVLANAHNLAEETPFTLAVRNGHTEIAGLLLKTLSVDVNEQNDLGKTPLHIAVATGCALDMVSLLLAANADIKIKDKQGRSPLSLARESGNTEMELLLRRENPKLRLLARTGNVVGMRRLITEGADIHTRDFTGQSAHGEAFAYEEQSAIDFLIDAGARLSLIEMISYANTDDVKRLLANGADVNEQALNSDTPLLRAVAEEKPDIVRLLLGAGAEVNYTNLWHSPLTQAALSNENTDILQLLLKAGADVNAADDYGSTALQNAAVMGNTRAVSLLIRTGADVNLANEDAIPPCTLLFSAEMPPPFVLSSQQAPTRTLACTISSHLRI